MKELLTERYGPQADDIQDIFLTEDQIKHRVKELAQSITIDYEGHDLLIVGVLKGVMCFVADLIREITIPITVDFMAIAAYSSKEPFRGTVRFIKDLDLPVEGRDVLFVEDVVDTGLTLNYLLRNLRKRNPASLEVCTLFDRPTRRLLDLPIRYKGFQLPDFFVVGYGLDYREQYRGLPFVGILKPSLLGGRNKIENVF